MERVVGRQMEMREFGADDESLEPQRKVKGLIEKE